MKSRVLHSEQSILKPGQGLSQGRVSRLTFNNPEEAFTGSSVSQYFGLGIMRNIHLMLKPCLLWQLAVCCS